MKTLRYILPIIVAMLMAPTISAKDEFTDPYEDYDEFLFMDMVLDDNIDTPPVSKKEHKAVKGYMEKLKNKLLKERFHLDMTRDDEVIIVTLPTDDLFQPNDTLLTPYGIKTITPLLKYLQDPDMFKVVFTVHTDNSGTLNYLARLSEARMNSFYGWITDNGRVPEDLVIIPYPMGDSDNIADNDTRANRALNRRIELYFIPGPKLITLAHEGKLKFEF